MKTLFVSLLATLVSLAAAFGADVDWKFYGVGTVDGLESSCFLDANGVTKVRADNHIKVWTKCLLQKDIDAVDLNKDLGDRAMSNAAQRLIEGYVPPIALTEDVTPNQAIVIMGREQIANLAPLEPQGRIFYELDCNGRKIKTLSISISSKGKSGSVHTPGEWLNVSPETNGNRLLKILCR